MNDTKKIRVLIIDDHAVVRQGLAFFASMYDELEIVGQAEDGVIAVEMARSLRPDVLVLDIQMPQMDGIEATKLIKSENPDIKILVLSSFAEEEQVLGAIDAGAQGYLLKDSSPEDLMRAILDVHRGETPFHSSIPKMLMNKLKKSSKPKQDIDPLTGRELEVLKLVAQGRTNKDISKQLSVTIRTVSTHVGNILYKLNLENRTQAALYALREGIAKEDKKQ